MKKLIYLIALIFAALSPKVSAQNVVGVYGGAGAGGERIFPLVEGKSVAGLPNFGVSWRMYSDQTFVGCFGIDFEYLQQGFSFSPFASQLLPDEEMYYYTRKINSLMVPIVWQPHVYMFERRVRVFLEAAATFSYHLSSTYDNDYLRQNTNGTAEDYKGKYEFETYRDNRFGYGLAFGGGISYLKGRYEFFARLRYYFGLSDIVKNRNKYYENTNQDPENPFNLTPIRSSLTNINLSFGIAYRLGKDEGFKSWNVVREPALKLGTDFNFKGENLLDQ